MLTILFARFRTWYHAALAKRDAARPPLTKAQKAKLCASLYVSDRGVPVNDFAYRARISELEGRA